MMSNTAQTPLMQQYNELKTQAQDALLLFRMGDFYELFGDDAKIASRLLEITLTSRDKNKENPLPMAGVPWHSVQAYIQRLLDSGQKVAIAEQLTEVTGTGTKAIVKREIVRTLTPGIQFENHSAQTQYFASLYVGETSAALSLFDLSAGRSYLKTDLELNTLASELEGRSIAHLIWFGRSPQKFPFIPLVEEQAENFINEKTATEYLQRQFQIHELSAFFTNSEAILSFGAGLKYALKSQKLEVLSHLQLPQSLSVSDFLRMGPQTAQHLDLEELFELLKRLGQIGSAMGARTLKQWLMNPLKVLASIEKRRQIVQGLAGTDVITFTAIQSTFKELYDLERILGRISTGLATPRDTYALGQTLALIPPLIQSLTHVKALKNEVHEIKTLFSKIESLQQSILKTQKENPPHSAKEGGIFNSGTDPVLDRLLHLTSDGQQWLLDFEAQERQATQIPSLKVKYNRVFGYSIEITHAHTKNVPAHYVRKQTMTGAERYITEELKKFEDELFSAETKRNQLEHELFLNLITEVAQHTQALMKIAERLSELDVFCAFTRLVQDRAWIFPQITESKNLKIARGRHPVVDEALFGKFISNSIELGSTHARTLMITGPNMGGKSTILRQTALLILLGQMGAPIPAESAEWGMVSAIYTRIGAQDAISRGQSTFMVEMSELAHLIHHADENALIILDEIGRGTSTYDGLSVAWAAMEWVSQKLKARTLFATHYHELTRLSEEMPELANAHLAVENTSDGLRFLYELKPGAVNESFGIHVAQMAGLPKPLIERAWEILTHLESTGSQNHPLESDISQLSFFNFSKETAPDPKTESALKLSEEMHRVDPNLMTPIQALQFVVKLKESLDPNPNSSNVS